MPECREKVCPASAFLRMVNCVSPASAFRHHGRSSTAGHALVRHCPAMHICDMFCLVPSDCFMHIENSQTRVSSKQTKINFGSNWNKPKKDLFRGCFGLFRETKKKKFWFVSVFRTYIETTQTNRSVSVCFVKPKRKNFDLFRCFEPISKQPKQTDLFRNKPKQTETTLNFLKNPKYTLF